MIHFGIGGVYVRGFLVGTRRRGHRVEGVGWRTPSVGLARRAVTTRFALKAPDAIAIRDEIFSSGVLGIIIFRRCLRGNSALRVRARRSGKAAAADVGFAVLTLACHDYIVRFGSRPHRPGKTLKGTTEPDTTNDFRISIVVARSVFCQFTNLLLRNDENCPTTTFTNGNCAAWKTFAIQIRAPNMENEPKRKIAL